MKKLFKKLALMVVALLTFSVGSNYTVKEVKAASGDIFDFTTQGYSNGAELKTIKLDNNLVAVFDIGSNSNSSPKYYSNGTAARVYGGNTITFKAADGVNLSSIDKIVFTYGTSDGSNSIKSSVGSFSTNTWTGADEEVEFTIGGTTGNRRIKSIQFYYTLNSSELSNEDKANNALSNLKAITPDVLNMEEKVYSLPKSNSETGITYNYSLVGDNSIFKLDNTASSLTITPKGAEKVATLTANVTCGDYTTESIIKEFKARETAYSVSEVLAEIDGFGTSTTTWGESRRVTGKISSIEGDNYFITDGEETIQIYKIDNISNYDLFIGDDITVFGQIGVYVSNYSVTPEMRYVDIEKHVSNMTNFDYISLEETSFSLSFDYSITYGEREVESKLETKEATATLSFSNANNRTSYSSSEQVWEENGIKLSNTGSVGNYTNPIRLYKNTVTTISLTNSNYIIKSITFSVNTGKGSIADNVNTIKTCTGVTVTSEINPIVADFSLLKANSVSFTSTNQIRWNNISVVYQYQELGDPGVEKYVAEESYSNVAILFGASVDASLFDGYTVSGGVLIDNAANYTETTIAEAYENGTFDGITTSNNSLSIVKDGNGNEFYSVGSVIEVIKGQVTTENKAYLKYEFVAAVYFTLTNEEGSTTVVLKQKAYSVKDMVAYYEANASSLELTEDQMKAVSAFNDYITVA